MLTNPFRTTSSPKRIASPIRRFSYLFKDKLTVRQMYQKYGAARGQRTVAGTPSQIVDQMEKSFVNLAVDGYLIQPPVLPKGLDEFVELVIPELQNRGLFRTEYEGETLRENLGLARPRAAIVAQSDPNGHVSSRNVQN